MRYYSIRIAQEPRYILDSIEILWEEGNLHILAQVPGNDSEDPWALETITVPIG